MTDKFDIFGLSSSTTKEDRYHRCGLPQNPFKTQNDNQGPIFPEHIKDQLREITEWLRDNETNNTPTPLTIQGSIGTGKSRILRYIESHLQSWPSTDKTFVVYTSLTSQGHAKASIGGLLLAGIEDLTISGPGISDRKWPDAIPFVSAIATASKEIEPFDAFSRALVRAQRAKGKAQVKLVQHISTWLRRQPLTPARMREAGLSRTLDWEGQLLPVLDTLLRCARSVGVLSHLYVLLDQLEDLFRKTFTPLRRSRLLTDLRALVDLIDQGAPIGLMLAITPDDYTSLGSKYSALASRLDRRKILLPALEQRHAAPFAQCWIDTLEGKPGWDPKKQPSAEELAKHAWQQLASDKGLLPSGDATPRDLLIALCRAVEERCPEQPD